MEKKKYHLKKQIIEAINSNDDALFSLLKSQWAHRFGVESLEELDNLDVNQFNQDTKSLDDQKIDQPQDDFLQGDKAFNVKNHIQENEIKTKEFDSIKDENNESTKIKIFKKADSENVKSESSKQFRDNKIKNEIEVLIPLPPKPKYGLLNKWLLRK